MPSVPAARPRPLPQQTRLNSVFLTDNISFKEHLYIENKKKMKKELHPRQAVNLLNIK